MKKKIAVAVSLLLVLALSVGGTIAWLTDSETVTNTFTIGNVDIKLKETDATGQEVNAQSFKFVPGKAIAKDPKVTVVADSEACYVFVKVVESINFKQGVTTNNTFTSYFTYQIAEGWESLTGVPGVYYKTVETSNADQAWYVLKGGNKEENKNGVVSVAETVTKDMIDLLDMSQGKEPKLTFTAYAIQKEGTGTVAEAWAKLNP